MCIELSKKHSESALLAEDILLIIINVVIQYRLCYLTDTFSLCHCKYLLATPDLGKRNLMRRRALFLYQLLRLQARDCLIICGLAVI